MNKLLPKAVYSKNGGIFVSGSNVYVAGTHAGKTGFWKNNVKTEIENNYSVGQVVAVDGSDVYVAGEIRSTSYNAAATWKSDIKTEMSTAVNPAQVVLVSARGIAIVNH